MKGRKIRVNCVSPGPIDTPMLRSIGETDEEKKAFVDLVTTSTAMNRIGTPDELAKVVVFLASDDSSYVTGIELFVDGGSAQI